MKNRLHLIIHPTVVALTVTGLCCASAFSQARQDATKEQPPEPNRVGSMAPVGSKPSKAELAKMETEKPGTPAKAAGKTATAKMSASDSAFMMEAAKGSADEVAMGKMAEKKGKSADVKNFGKMMVADHTKANNELMALAKTKGVKLDPRPHVEKMNDADFDRAYLAEMVKDHQKDIAAFEKEAKSGSDADVKAWAKKMLPTLKGHLKAAQAAQKKMAKSN